MRIESAAREPGSRAKIAVSSGDRDVDPVGACVGMRGARVQAVVQELRGEKIDIVPFSQDAATFVCNALQPAEVSRVLIDEGNRSMEIIVPDDQLSLGIGRKGQNVRLASQLTGWRLDIHSESRIQEIKDRAWESLGRITGCTDFLVQTLYNHGIRSAVELIASERSYLLQFPGVDEENIDAMLESAQGVANDERERDRRLKLEAEHAARIAECAKEMRAMIRRTPEERMLQIKGMGASTLEVLTEKNILVPERLMELGVDGIVNEADVRIQEAKQLFYGAKHLLQEEADLRERSMRWGFALRAKTFFYLDKNRYLQSRRTRANKTQLKHETATEEITQEWALDKQPQRSNRPRTKRVGTSGCASSVASAERLSSFSD